jgi:hypothetical protein
MRHYRSNADEGLRRLERAAAAGDREASVALIVHKLRAGLINAMTLEEKVALRRAVVDSLRDESWDVFLLEQIGDWGRMNAQADRWGWFPLHVNNTVCPRGHRDGPQGWFTITDGSTSEQPRMLNEQGAFLDYDQDDMTGMVVAVACGQCLARWPLSGDEGVTWVDQ